MKDTHSAVDRLLHGLATPRAPVELRSITLARTGAAWARESADPWRRLWENRRLRWAWAVTVLALLAANATLGPRHHDSTPPAGNVLAARAAADRELAPLVELPRIDSRFVNVDVAASGDGGGERSHT